MQYMESAAHAMINSLAVGQCANIAPHYKDIYWRSDNQCEKVNALLLCIIRWK